MRLSTDRGLPAGERVSASAGPGDGLSLLPTDPGCWGPYPLGWDKQWPPRAQPGRAGSGVTQTQKQGHRVPSGPFKGTFDLNPGAQ